MSVIYDHSNEWYKHEGKWTIIGKKGQEGQLVSILTRFKHQTPHKRTIMLNKSIGTVYGLTIYSIIDKPHKTFKVNQYYKEGNEYRIKINDGKQYKTGDRITVYTSKGSINTHIVDRITPQGKSCTFNWS